MSGFEWSPQFSLLLVLISALFAALGYLIAQIRLSKQAALLAGQLEQLEEAMTISTRKQDELALQRDELREELHQQALSGGRLQEQLESARQTETRLIAEKAQHREHAEHLNHQYASILQDKYHAETQYESALTELRALKHQEQILQARLVTETEKVSHLQEQYTHLLRKHTTLEATLQEREMSHRREMASFEAQKASLSEQFKVLSSEIFEAKSRSLQETSKHSLHALMNPFQQSIDQFKKEIQDMHYRETIQQGELRKELESLKELNRKITTEAHELSTALRGQKKVQGNWGEMILENILERSGLQLGKDYKREVSITTEEGRQRPDAVVYLPQGKHLIIDAKVSLNAYTRYINSEDEAERRQALREHVQAVSARIKELADRDYYKLPGLNSPEIVFMFIPIESAFVEALKADETLFQQAIEQNVLVATPTTLLTSLNIVRQLWRYEDQNKHTAALASKAENVFKKFNTFLGSFEKIKKGLEVATQAYTLAEGQLVSGKGNLIKQVGEFKNLAPAIKAELPTYFTEKAALEIDFIPAEGEEGKKDQALKSS